MPEEPTASPTLGTRVLGRVRAMLPWALGIGLIVWITGRVSWGEAWEAAGEAELGAFAVLLVGAAIYWFLLDSWGYSFLFSRFNAPVSWAEARSVRGLTYLLTPINWNVGTAAVILHLRQSKGISAVDGGSSMMLYMAADGFVILGLLIVGIAVVPDTGSLGSAVPGIVGFFALQCVFLLLVLSNSPKWGWLERIRDARILQSYRKAKGSDLGLLLGVRTIYFAGFVAFFAFGTRAFDVEVPIGFMALTMPLVMGSAMFTPAGMGSQQAVMLELWDAHGTAAAILAFGVAFPVGLIIARLGIGLLYLGDLREFRRARKAALAEEAVE
jgi:hypothetical protein